MATGDFADKLRITGGVVPARRDLLTSVPEDSYSPAFYNSALFARSWLDPDSEDTDNIFRNMIDSVLSNSARTGEAISDANGRLGLLLLQQ